MVISQGDVFWADLGPPTGSGPGCRRPVVVIQNDWFNASAINTAVVCSVTSNLALGRMPGNVRLRKGEANLLRRSVVNISQIATVDRAVLHEKIGTLSARRVHEILGGIVLLLKPATGG